MKRSLFRDSHFIRLCIPLLYCPCWKYMWNNWVSGTFFNILSMPGLLSLVVGWIFWNNFYFEPRLMNKVDNLTEKFHLGWKKISGYDCKVDFFYDFYWLKRQYNSNIQMVVNHGSVIWSTTWPSGCPALRIKLFSVSWSDKTGRGLGIRADATHKSVSWFSNADCDI